MPRQTNTAPASKIIPHIWFDKNAVEAAKAYASIFPNSSVDNTYALPAETPSGPPGSVDVVELTVFGQQLVMFNAGPHFKLNPAISFIANFDPILFGNSASRDKEARSKLDEAWEKLSEGGVIRMPIDKYPFSERYGWIEDKYGVSWQLMLTDPKNEPRPGIIPSLMFTQQHAGQAREAVDFYMTVFKNAKRGMMVPYGAGQGPDKEGTIMFSDFMLENQWFAAMDSAQKHDFVFNEALSLMVTCADQNEIDYYWEKLSAVPSAEQCGWVKDRFGVSWQIAPTVLREMLMDPDKTRAKRVTEAFLPMKKLDIVELERAYAGSDAPRGPTRGRRESSRSRTSSEA